MKSFRTTTWIRLLAGMAFLFVGATTGTALAEDWKVYPANYCQPSDLGTTTNYFNSKGHLVNPKNSFLTVLCPIVRDHHSPGEGPKYVKVRYLDQHGSDRVSCRMESRQLWGKLLWASPTKRSPSGTLRGDLTIYGPNGCGGGGICIGDTLGTYYHLVCALPAKSRRASEFISYFVKEDD